MAAPIAGEVSTTRGPDLGGGGEEVAVGGLPDTASFSGGFGFDAMGGPLLNMNLGGDFNQMQMMMSMQNGMMPNNFTNFSMMGMCAPRLWREEGMASSKQK